MNKILLIIQREYLSRVKKKSFIWMTILVPALFIGMYAFLGYLLAKGDEMGDIKKVLVVDENGLFKEKLKNTPTIKFSYSGKSYGDERKSFVGSDNDYLLYLPSNINSAQILSEKKPSASLTSNIEDQVNGIIKNKKLLDAGIDVNVLKEAEKGINIESKQITEKGEEDAGTIVAYAIGFLTAILIYMSLFIYGTQVMRGVIEEKTSRVIEVIISSVKPFQLMLGKIIGVGMVGLTQFALWIIISIALTGTIGTAMMGGKMKDMAKTEQVSAASDANATLNGSTAIVPSTENDNENEGKKIWEQVKNIPVAYTIFTFLFYFLFGYLLYSAVFAAVGSAVDNETETQQFMLPITLPLVFTFILSLNFIINNPDSSLSFWLSMIPFTSPIAMMIRIPFGVPAWQLALSMLLMVGGFLFTTWVAARIYRVGVLMYGKKVTYKELAKWFFYKE